MDIYHYHPETGVFLQARPARRDPRDPTRHLVPAHATPTPPPDTDAEHVAAFDRSAGRWRVIDKLSAAGGDNQNAPVHVVVHASLPELRGEIRRVLTDEITKNEALRREIARIGPATDRRT